MSKLLIYYAHPGQKHSNVNAKMARLARQQFGIEFVDLYAEYPRFQIDIDKEQQRLIEHDIIIFQFPIFWYSSPSIIKEWQDLVLEQGFAYGETGTQLAGKTMILAVTAAGTQAAYSTTGHQNFPLRTFLRPLEQTATLCHMRFSPPYVLFGSLHAKADGRDDQHIQGYQRLICALRDETYDFTGAAKLEFISSASLPITAQVQ